MDTRLNPSSEHNASLTRDNERAVFAAKMQYRKELKASKRELLLEMKQRGIKKTSCFNGGLSGDEYRFNARLFELNTMLER